MTLLLMFSAARDTAGIVEVGSGDVGAGPYYMDIAGETYRLTEDMVTTGSGFIFAADDVTLDLNQHVLTFGASAVPHRYGVAVPPPYAHVNPMWTASDITIWRHADGATIRNGTVIQGTGRGANCAAIIAYQAKGVAIDGVSIVVSGDDTHGIELEECKNISVFGNTIIDSTGVISNRHAGRAAIDIINAADGQIEVFSNTIRNARQWGIRVSRRPPARIWGRIFNNEIDSNTIASNGYSIGIHGAKLDVFDNAILARNGRGIHVERCDSTRVHGNRVDVVEQPTWDEYDRVSAHGIKLESCSNAEIYANDVLSRGVAHTLDAVSNGAALSIGVGAESHVRIHDNTFSARHMGGSQFDPKVYVEFATCIEFVGMDGASGLQIENNTFVTNDRFVTVNEWHGNPDPADAADVHIRANTWMREESVVPTRKCDIFLMDASVVGLEFIDNVGGDFKEFGTGWPWLHCSWSVGYTVTVRTMGEDGDPIANAKVEVRDVNGDLIASPLTDAGGEVRQRLADYGVTTEGEAGSCLEIRESGPYEFSAILQDKRVAVTRVVDRAGLRLNLASTGR